VVRGSSWSIRNANSGGAADATFTFGSATSRPVVGDWNGDGIDRRSRRRQDVAGRERAGHGSGDHVQLRRRGPAVAGDWDGNGADGPGRVAQTPTRVRWFLKNQLAPGVADLTFYYGKLGVS
jgi:hypothetical protein